jgi:hypothetical protein
MPPATPSAQALNNSSSSSSSSQPSGRNNTGSSAWKPSAVALWIARHQAHKGKLAAKLQPAKDIMVEGPSSIAFS